MLSLIFSELRDAIFARVGQHAIRAVGLQIFRHLHGLALRFHLARQTGGLNRAIERGTKGIQTLLSFLLFNILPTFFEIGLVCVVLWRMFDGWLALATGATVTLYIAYTLLVTEWRAKFRRQMNETDSEANTKAIESLLNYETVKYFGNEEHEARRFDASLSRYERAAVRSQVSLSILNIGQAAIISAGLTLVMWMAAQGIAEGRYTLGDFVLVNTYLLQLYSPLSFFGFIYREIKQAIIDMERMFELLDQDREIADRPGARDLAVSGAEVEFRDVRFGYDERRPILKGVSFRIPAGKTVAVVGPSGAGKSTIARLLFRFYDTDAGAILIDGQDLREVTQQSVRAAIGVVPQDTVLFNDTIRYNIGYGHPGASDAEIEAAARLAHVHDLIMAMPDGYGTMVGERGLKLSGGEKQRVAIARTLLKNPAVFLFDEATSALDTHTEREIQANLREVSQGRSTLIIAHRLSTVADADEIIVLADGLVVERGRHQELLARDGVTPACGAAAAKPGGLTSPPHCPKIAPLNPRPRHAGIPAAPEVLVCSAADLVNGGLGVKVPVHDAAGQTTAFFVRYQDRVHGYLNRCATWAWNWTGKAASSPARATSSCARATAPPTSPTPACAGGPCRTAASRRWMCRNATARSIGAPPARSARWTPPERGPSLAAGRLVCCPWLGAIRRGRLQARAASDRRRRVPCRRRFPVGIAPRQHRADHQLHLVEDHQGQHHDAHLRRAEQHGRQRNARGQRFLRATEHQRDLVLLGQAQPRAPQVVISSTAPSNTALTSTMVARSSGGKACQMPCATASLKAV